jgi:hypothetical protein
MSDNDYFILVSDVNFIDLLRGETKILITFKNTGLYNAKGCISNCLNKPLMC